MNDILEGDGRARFIAQFSFVPMLKEFELEIETIEEKSTQLDAVIAEFMTYRIALDQTGTMPSRALLPQQCTGARTWIGPAFYQGRPVDGRRQYQIAGRVEAGRPETHNYVVRSVIWHVQEERDRA